MAGERGSGDSCRGRACFAHHKDTRWTRVRLHRREVRKTTPPCEFRRWFDKVLHNFPRLPLPEAKLEGQEQEEIQANAATS